MVVGTFFVFFGQSAEISVLTLTKLVHVHDTSLCAQDTWLRTPQLHVVTVYLEIFKGSNFRGWLAIHEN